MRMMSLMKRRMFIFLAVLAIIGGGAAAVLASNRHSGKAEAASARFQVSTNGTLQGASASQLAGVGITLAPTTVTPTISVAQAEQAAERQFSDAILGVSLADCTVAGVDHGACYAVSLQPSAGKQKVCSPILNSPSPCGYVPASTFEVVLVSATEGSVLTGAQSNT
jgi:hypothetical protein